MIRQCFLSDRRGPTISVIVWFSKNLILIAVDEDMLIYRSIHSAFDDFVAVSIFGEVDHCCLTCFEQEYIVVCYTSYCHGLLIRNQLFCSLIHCIYLSGQICIRSRL